jgi:uncharacterized cupin superfamily protein
MKHVTRFPRDGATGEAGGPDPARVVAGAPAFDTLNLFEGENGRLFSGLWRASPGSWRVVYDEWEFCQINRGRARLIADDGASMEIGPGDAFILHPGFEGVWEVIEPIEKAYVILLPPDAAA